MSSNVHHNRRAPQRARAVVILFLLLTVAGLMMMWTWTADTLFVVLSGVPVVSVLVVCLYGRHQSAFVAIGGPLDGARVPSSVAGPDTENLVLRTRDGGRASYAVVDSHNLVYRGETAD